MRVARLVALFALSLPGIVSAQTQPHRACVDRTGTIDALVSANQTRSVEQDLQQLRRLYQWDRVEQRELIEHEGEEHWTGSVLLASAIGELSGFPLCRSGELEEVDLDNVWLTLMASLENHRREWGLRLFMFAPQTKLAPDEREISADGTEGPASYVSYDQFLFALEAQVTRYFSVMGGWLTPRSLTVQPGIRGPDPRADTEAGRGQPLLQVGVPAASFYTSLILTPGTRAVETLYFDLHRLPIGETPLELSARAGYLSNEERVFTQLGGSWLFPKFGKAGWTPRAEAEVATEYGGFRLREASLGASATIPSIQYKSIGYGHFEVYGRLSLFNSAWLERQTDARRVVGGEVGLRAGFGSDVLMLIVEPYAAVNRPETLAIFSEGVGHLGWGATVALRVTPLFF